MAEQDVILSNLSSSFLGSGVGAFMATFIAAFVVAAIIICLAVYIYNSFALMMIANKMKIKNSWLAWIPIANVFLLTQMAGISGWFTLMILITGVPQIGWLAYTVFTAWMWWKIAPKIKFPEWYGILMVLPIVNLVVIGLMAWGKAGKR
jgi:hypothetical protein